MDTYTVLNVLSAYAVEKNDLDLRRQLNIPPNKLFVNPDFEGKLDKVMYTKCSIISILTDTIKYTHETIEYMYKDFARARSCAMRCGMEKDNGWFVDWFVNWTIYPDDDIDDDLPAYDVSGYDT